MFATTQEAGLWLENEGPMSFGGFHLAEKSALQTRLRGLRARARLGQNEMARQLNWPDATYRYYESPKFPGRFLDPDKAQEIARVLVGRGSPPIKESEILALTGTAGISYPEPTTPTEPASPSRPAYARPAPPTGASLASVPRDVPLLRTVPNSKGFSVRLDEPAAELAPRPPGLSGTTAVFALYATDDTMSPWREPGELVYVHELRPPRVGSYVLVELTTTLGDPDETELKSKLPTNMTAYRHWITAPMGQARPDEPLFVLRKLAATDEHTITLESYTPREQVVVPRHFVKRILRVLTITELLLAGA